MFLTSEAGYSVVCTQLSLVLFPVRNGSEQRRKGRFCVRNGSVTPGEEGSAKQTQVMLLGGWSPEDLRTTVNHSDTENL
jgi:hypothetical protein